MFSYNNSKRFKGGDNILITCYNLILLFFILYHYVDKINITHKQQENDFTICVGHSRFRKIIVNMLVTPHLLTCGLSGMGKSKCIEYAMKNKNCVLLNAFRDDFTSINCLRINDIEQILKFLENIKDKYQKKPLYIVIDEMLVLCMNKKINKAILDLLATGRHYNIFLIGIAQRGTKQDIPFKDLFNARLTFRQVEASSYGAILGYYPEENLKLNKQEFILFSDDIYRGRTYDLE